MANMLNKSTEFGGAFKANEMVLTFAGFGAGYLITGVQAGYTVDVVRIRELGSQRVYYIEGDGQGTISLNRVTGPGSSITPLIRAYGDVCSIPQNVINLSFAAGLCSAVNPNREPTVSFTGVLLNTWGLSAQSQGQAAMATTSLSGTFEALDTDDNQSISGALNALGNVAAAAGQ